MPGRPGSAESRCRARRAWEPMPSRRGDVPSESAIRRRNVYLLDRATEYGYHETLRRIPPTDRSTAMWKTPEEVQAMKDELQAWLDKYGFTADEYVWLDVGEPDPDHYDYLGLRFSGNLYDVMWE